MRLTTLFSFCLVLILLAGCYNAGYEETEKKEAGPEEQQNDDRDLGEQGLLDILEEAEKGGEEAVVKEPLTPEPSAETKEEAEEAVEEEPESKGLMQKGDVTSDITVTEGELVEIKLKAYDPDGDKLTFTYGPPLDQNGRWQTRIGDEGTHKIDVTVSDGRSKTVKTITVRVLHKNRAPVIEPLPKIVVNEGDTINLAPRVRDSEGQPVKVTYSGWMSEARRTTGFDDAGNYRVTITASDGELEATSYVDIEVKDINRAPVFEAVIE